MVARLIGVDFARLPGMNRLTLASGRWPGARAIMRMIKSAEAADTCGACSRTSGGALFTL